VIDESSDGRQHASGRREDQVDDLSLSETPIRLASEVESGDACLMRGVCSLIWLALVGLFHSRVSLEAEILALRHQLNVLRRISPKKPTFRIIDRLVFAGLYRLAPGILDALVIVTPETVIRWHRAVFVCFGDGNRDVELADQRCRSKFAN
jgi:hypothetical protein